MMPRLLLAAILMQSISLHADDRAHGRSMVISQGGIVATSQVLASQAGAQILAQGGSAIDAAIAANAVLGVVEPGFDGIGGDLFVIYREAKTGRTYGLNASGWAPKRMSAEYFKQKKLTRVPGEGIDSVSVPGCVDGWHKLHERFGTLPWKALFDASITYADKGFPVQEMDSTTWNSPRITNHAEGKRVFHPNGRAPIVGEIFRNPGLAQAMRFIAEGGRDEFYKGRIAQAILRTMQKHDGVMSAEDLAEFSSEWVTPITTDYRGWKVSEIPPNGQGISALIMLNLMERFKPGPTSADAEWMHTKIESMKLAYSDLATYIADPKFAKYRWPNCWPSPMLQRAPRTLRTAQTAT